MTDELYNTLILFSNIFTFSIEGYYLYKFFNRILKPDLSIKAKLRNKAVIIPVGYITCMMILKYIPIEMEFFTAYGIGILTATGLSYLVYKKDTVLKLYISVTFMAVRYLGYYLVYDIGVLIFDSLNKTGNQLSNQPLWEIFIIVFYLLIIVLLQWLVLGFVINIIIKKFKNKKASFTLSEAVLLIVPSITGMFGGLLLNYSKRLTTEGILGNYTTFFMILGTALLLSGIVTNIILFQNMKERKDEEKEKIIFEKQIQNISSHIQKVEQLYTGIRGLKHDLRNHISNINNLIIGEQYSEVLEYSNQFETAMEQLEFRHKTGNPITDVIINEFSTEAEGKGVVFNTDFVFPIETKIKAFDLSIILSNGLENAIEACENLTNDETRIIHIRSFRRKNAYLIQIKNTYSQKVEFDGNGILKTTKEDKELHGIGLKNIQRIARKYQGEIDIEFNKENEFTLTVMLMCD